MSTAQPDPALSGARIAIVTGHFSPEVGYQEVDLAAAFTRLGADVLVVTSTHPSRSARSIVGDDYPAGLARTAGCGVLRLEPRLAVGPKVLGRKVLPAIQDFGPDYVILVAPGKLFGLDVFAPASAPWRRIAIIQDNSEDGRSEGSFVRRALRAAAHRTLTQPAYRRVVRNADRIVLNVPETREIISPWLGERERARLSTTAIDLRLGFDPETFYFDLEGRRRWRARYDIGDEEILLVTCTRATAAKRLERIVDTASRLRESGRPVTYVLAGLLDDAYGRAIRERARSLGDPKGFLLLPLLRHDEMRELFSACDVGFWPRTAITIQQAMGTGLPVVLRMAANVSHLLIDGKNGWYVKPGESDERVIVDAITATASVEAVERPLQRGQIAHVNGEYLSYYRIALDIVRDLDSGSHAGSTGPPDL